MSAPDSVQISGYAWKWADTDVYGDSFLRGAFTPALSLGEPAMFCEHRGGPVGVWLEAQQDDTGLWLVGHVTDPVSARRVWAGEVRGLSVGFHPWSVHGPRGRRTHSECSIAEASICASPALKSAVISRVDRCAPRSELRQAVDRLVALNSATRAYANFNLAIQRRQLSMALLTRATVPGSSCAAFGYTA